MLGWLHRQNSRPTPRLHFTRVTASTIDADARSISCLNPLRSFPFEPPTPFFVPLRMKEAFLPFCSTMYAGYTGLKWRRLREVGNEIKEKKAMMPQPDAEGNVPPSPIAAEVQALEAERKDLASAGFRDKHWNVGNLLLVRNSICTCRLSLPFSWLGSCFAPVG